jgi:predicted ATPase/DNA-binding winged helix-turn-helix (wHTH) protein
VATNPFQRRGEVAVLVQNVFQHAILPARSENEPSSRTCCFFSITLLYGALMSSALRRHRHGPVAVSRLRQVKCGETRLKVARPTTSVEHVVSFGPFRLLPAQRLLLEGDTPVRLGSRALEILIALVERPGELVSKGELLSRVWPDTFVEEGNLKVHVAALRRTLGGSQSSRYLATVPGRGYRFVAPIELAVAGRPPPAHQTALASERAHNLPALPTRTIGRAGTLSALLAQLPQRRFISIVGAGGIGKTTVALAMAEALITAYEDGVRFVDLAPLSDPRFVPSALASALGLAIDDAVPGLLAFLRDKRMLLVLDNCEHVIEAAAPLAAQIISGTFGVHILATSREPLRAEGERVHRLSPLESPPSSSGLTAAGALGFPAVELFVERAAASLDGFELSDATAPVVADICRKLDGIALAIELAATRIDAFGVRELSALLDDRFRLLAQGKRTALPRHQTLTAALDWSYEHLSEDERVALRRLSVFAGAFTLDSATAVVAGADIDVSRVIEDVAELVAKSLVSADVGGAVVHYRLLNTTRAYALQKLTASGELQQVAQRHAEYHRDLFERAGAELEARPTAESLGDYGRRIDDVRAALKWAFSPSGDASIGVALTIASIPLWMGLSLMDECRVFVERALASGMPEQRRSERDEMKLYVALGTALLYARGPLPETDDVWTKALRIAESLDDREYQLRVLLGLSVYRVYVGDYRGVLRLAEAFRRIATSESGAAFRPIGDRLTGTALYYLGDNTTARHHIERMLSQYVVPVQRSHIARFHFDHRVAARSTLSNILWMHGLPDQAVRSAHKALEDARALDHALSLCNVLAFAACPIALYVGDWATAEEQIAVLLDHSEKHALTIWCALAQCLKGMLLTGRGDLTGLQLLRGGIDRLREARFALRSTTFLGALAAGWASAGEAAEARKTIDDALERAERSEEHWYVPELLRIKGQIFRLDGSAKAASAAEEHYRRALELARRQDALSWELRAATSLAGLWHEGGKTAEADELLSSVYNRFTEGFETVDLKTARALIDDLRTRA